MASQQDTQTINSNPGPNASYASDPGHFMLLSFRWVVTTSWFLYLLAAILVGISLTASFYTDAWHWFQRSGALMVSIGAILSTRHALGLILGGMIDDSKAQSHIRTEKAPYLSDIGELRTCVCGFVFVATGTFIWAYGDLTGCLVHWDMSCMA
jgi:hypothetical protein